MTDSTTYKQVNHHKSAFIKHPEKLFLVIFLSVFFLTNFINADTFGSQKSAKKNYNQIESRGYGKISVKTWANDKKSAFSFTFDDSFISQYTYALPILDQFGIKATFFVISGAVTDGLPQDWRYGYWWQFRQMAAEGHEIGAHTMTHPDLTTLKTGSLDTPGTLLYELYQSKMKIENEIPGYKCISLAYPYCSYDSTVENESAKYFEAARTCGDYVVSKNISGMKWYKINSEEPTFDLPRNSVSDDQDEFNSYINNVQNKSINTGGWSVFFAHEVLPMQEIAAGADTSSWYPVSTDWLTQLCEWAKLKSDEGELWIATFGNVVKYTKERENFNYNIVSADSNRIEISTTTGLDTSIYNYPITTDISVPAGWKYADILQGSSDTAAIPLPDSSGYFVRVNIIPGKGNILILRGALFNVSGNVTYDDPTSTPVPDVKIDLLDEKNDIIDSTTTDGNGKYEFGNIISGKYSLALFKSGQWKTVNSSNALAVMKYYNRQIALDSLQQKAGDVNGDNKINSTDALLIARLYTGRIKKFSCPEWIFSKPDAITIKDSDLTINFKAITAGDVNKF